MMKLSSSRSVHEILVMLSYAIDIEKNKRLFHAWRVCVIANEASRGSLTPGQRRNLFYACLLHDIGGTGFPLHVIHYLSKHDKVSQNILLSHPIIGGQLASSVSGLSESARMILDHHEWANGQGYPRAKTLKNITPGAQFIRIADSIDIALRKYKGKDLEALEDELKKRAGKEFSKNLFQQTFRRLKKKNILELIVDDSELLHLFRLTEKEVGLLRLPAKTDTVGSALNMVAEVADMKHPYTFGHSQRVSRYSLAVALSLKLAHDELTRIKWAALMHDIGKISRSRPILDKPSKLSEKERRHIEEHALISNDILSLAPSLGDIGKIGSGHHEHFDGSGYPAKLKGQEIPLSTRIISVCDAFDAMTSNRPYRDALTIKTACDEIERKAGKQFDPKVVKAALPILRSLNL